MGVRVSQVKPSNCFTLASPRRGANGGNCLPQPAQTRSWDLRKSDEKHAGRNWGGGCADCWPDQDSTVLCITRALLYCRAVMNYVRNWQLIPCTARCPLPPPNMLHFFMINNVKIIIYFNENVSASRRLRPPDPAGGLLSSWPPNKSLSTLPQTSVGWRRHCFQTLTVPDSL